MPATSDERGAPSIDELDVHGRTLLYETLLNDRRPVAIVGSGMSVVYGGVSWETSVQLALRYAIRRIAQCVDKMNDDPSIASRLAEMKRDRIALEAFEADKRAFKSANHKYVALDLCDRALERVDELENPPPCPIVGKRSDGTSSFRAFMQKVYRDDTYYITELLCERFDAKIGPDADEETRKIWKRLQSLSPQQVQQLAVAIYSIKFIEPEVAPDLKPLWKDFVADIARPLTTMGFAKFEALPIDRRSSLAFFLAPIPKARKRALLSAAIEKIERADDPETGSECVCGHIHKATPIEQVKLSPPRPILDPISRLREWLRTKRYMTLNFDYVLEKKLMLEDFRSTEPPPYGIEEAIDRQQLTKDGGTGGLTRRFPDGQMASTDVYDDKAVGRLFEFALDSADYRAQILHLHGRADRPETMLLTDRDSNRQYRRDRSSRTSLEQALDVTLTGNPIIFVGIGLSEAEITRPLRELVSRGHATPHNPIFAIMALEEDGTTGWRNQMASNSQYGINLIQAGMPTYWKGLPYFLKVIDRLVGRLDEKSWSTPFVLTDPSDDPFPDVPFPDDTRPRRKQRSPSGAEVEQPARNNAMAGDRLILDHIVTALRSDKRPEDEVVEAWKDYLGMFRSKLYTFAAIEAMHDVYEGSIDYARHRRLPASREEFENHIPGQLALLRHPEARKDDDPPDANDRATGDLAGLTVRDFVLWAESEDADGRIRRPTGLEHGWRHRPVSSDWKLSGGVVKLRPSLSEQDPIMMEACDGLLKEPKPYATFFSPLGTGKGRLLRILSDRLSGTQRSGEIISDQDKCPHLIINCNFAIEFDSVLAMVLRFVWQFRANPDDAPPPKWNRLHEIERCLKELSEGSGASVNRGRKAPAIVLAGLERLIDRRGQSVAPELDLMLSKLIGAHFARSRFRLVIIGADGCERYFDEKFAQPLSFGRRKVGLSDLRLHVPWRHIGQDCKLLHRGFLGHLYRTAWDEAAGRVNTAELRDQLNFAANRPTEAMQPNSARSRAIEAMIRVVLDNWHDLAFAAPGPTGLDSSQVAANRLRASLDLRILQAMSFIGLPIESRALHHLNTPAGLLKQITRFLRRQGDPNSDADIERSERCASLARLSRFGFVVTIAPYPAKEGSTEEDPDNLRIVLHRCAMAELRERIGVRSGDELLSNSFSMTIAMSMPTDLTVASEDIQRDLKTSVSRFRGAWRDTALEHTNPDIAEALDKLRAALALANVSKFDLLMIEREGQLRQLERAIKMMATDMQVTIRAGAGVIRSFFSAASLVAQMPTKIVLDDGDLGEFEEHRRRLGHLVSRFRESQRSYETARALLGAIGKAHHIAQPLVDDLLQRVQKLADTSISRHPALYSGELVWLLNERSVIALLQGDLYEAQRGFREAEQANRIMRSRIPGQAWRRIEINRALVRIERGHIAEARTNLLEIANKASAWSPQRDPIADPWTKLADVINWRKIDGAPQPSSEDQLTAPLIASYLGLCDHLGGNYAMAEEKFNAAIKGLSATEQQRALAVTYTRLAALRYGLRRMPDGDRAAQEGRAIAEAGRQMDILWRARLTEVRGMNAHAESSRIVALFKHASEYAKVMDLPRVLIQAQRGLAEHHLQLGDLEAAGIFASEAMNVAVRCGMVLQRIALRVLTGRILIAKGDNSGDYLLRRAIAHADRVGYQLQVDRAMEALNEASATRRG